MNVLKLFFGVIGIIFAISIPAGAIFLVLVRTRAGAKRIKHNSADQFIS